MNDDDWLEERFEAHRPRLRAVAYRMLGSLGEADDAVQESWLRLDRADADDIENLRGWLTTVVSRVCLDMLRRRGTRREQPAGIRVPDPIVSDHSSVTPEQEVLMADSVGLAMLVVLDTLTPAERLAFILHDVFAVPHDEIAPIVGRSPAATRKLASRARRRVQTQTSTPDPDVTRQRTIVDAFFAASRLGDFDALLAVLDPDVVLHADRGATPPAASRVILGAQAVAKRALTFSSPDLLAHPVLVNGAAGAVVTRQGRPFAVMGFTVTGGAITQIDILADPDRLRHLDLPAPGT